MQVTVQRSVYSMRSGTLAAAILAMVAAVTVVAGTAAVAVMLAAVDDVAVAAGTAAVAAAAGATVGSMTAGAVLAETAMAVAAIAELAAPNSTAVVTEAAAIARLPPSSPWYCRQERQFLRYRLTDAVKVHFHPAKVPCPNHSDSCCGLKGGGIKRPLIPFCLHSARRHRSPA